MYISAVKIPVNLFFWFSLANSNFLTLLSVTHTIFITGDSQELIGPYSNLKDKPVQFWEIPLKSVYIFPWERWRQRNPVAEYLFWSSGALFQARVS